MQALNVKVDVIRNDELDWASLNQYDKFILSPGPGLPDETTNLLMFIDLYHSKKPILGICLGMQALAEFFGGELINQEEVKHGVQEELNIVHKGHLFKDLPRHFKIGLYHSWKVNPESLGVEWDLLAYSKSGVLMAIEHKKKPIFGVQFHPESIMTEYGKEILANFLFN